MEGISPSQPKKETTMRKHARNIMPPHTCAPVDRTADLLRAIDIELLQFPMPVENFKLSPSSVQAEMRRNIETIEFSDEITLRTVPVRLGNPMGSFSGPSPVCVPPSICMMLLSGGFIDPDHSYTAMWTVSINDGRVCAPYTGYTFPMLAERIITTARQVVPYRVGDTTNLTASLLITYEPANDAGASTLVVRPSGNVWINHYDTPDRLESEHEADGKEL
jgi:hypothetical protein